MNKNWLNITLLYLFIVAFLGAMLRLMSLTSLGINYNNLLHAHSHVAFLGWIFNLLFIILVYAFLTSVQQAGRQYQIQFWLIQIANIGMLLTFPVQGYGLFSILFSTMHILISLWFTFRFLKDASANFENKSKHYLSFLFIKTALFFMILSSVGPFSLAPIISMSGSGTELYYNAIYFYLHFQYNGWFTFATIGLFFWLLENKNISFSVEKGKLFFKILLFSCIPAYLLSVLWIKPHGSVYVVAGFAALFQILALLLFLPSIYKIKKELKKVISSWGYLLLSISFFSYCLKVTFQLVSAIPYAAQLAYNIRNFIIGYLHIVFIGFTSLFLLGFLIAYKELNLTKTGKTGLLLFIGAFAISELFLFAQATLIWIKQESIPYFAPILFYVSLVMVLGVVLLILRQFVYIFQGDKLERVVGSSFKSYIKHGS